MAFTKEDLLNLGLTEEQAKEVFALHGKDLNETKSVLDTITQERDSLKSQLQNTEAQLETLKTDANTSSELKDALEQLQANCNKYKADAAAELAQTQKVNAINLALKDTTAHNPLTLMKFIDVDAIELDDLITGLKESVPYLFVEGFKKISKRTEIVTNLYTQGSYQKHIDFEKEFDYSKKAVKLAMAFQIAYLKDSGMLLADEK